MTTKQAAKWLGLSWFYLRNLRQGLHEHDGPQYTMIKSNNQTIPDYTEEDLAKWLLEVDRDRWRNRYAKI